ncbi:MAG: glycosyltransferase 87 family protein, partial [Streptosporangiaceae bacterium]
AQHAGQALYAAHAQFSFTYPPFAAALFRLGTTGTEGWLAAVITVVSVGALVALVWMSLAAAGVRPRPETVLAITALSALLWPVAYTLHLGEVNLVIAVLVGSDLLRQRDGGWWQGIATGVAAGIKLTPLIFVVYLLITRRPRAAATAAGAFAATIAAGWLLLPGASRVFWLDGVFAAQSRVGNAANPSNQSLAGAAARLAGGRLTGAHDWWLAAAVVCALAGLAVAAWAHQRGWRLGGVCCCAITGLLVSPFSWAHHWVWSVSLLIWTATTAWRHRSAAGGAATAVVAVAFSGLIPLTWPGRPVNPALMLTSDLYVLCGLAVLAVTAVMLARQGRPPGGPRIASPRPGPLRAASPSLDEWTRDPGWEVRLPSRPP